MGTRARRIVAPLSAALLAVAGGWACRTTSDHDVIRPPLEEVATGTRRWTGIAVSKEGRVFVNYPRWSEDVPVSVAELMEDGSTRPYPNEELNGWKPGDNPAGAFVCVQSVHVDAENRLWILDPANPGFGGVVDGGAKLMRVNLDTDEIERTYHFDASVAPERSYLNDVRVDTRTETAFITDSGIGALVVVDLESGEARRVLEDHASTKAEAIDVVVEGVPFPNRVQADGIALDADGGWLYYQALTARTLYRVPTKVLRDESLDPDERGRLVQKFASSGVSDGLLYTPDGVYVSAIEFDAIRRVDVLGSVRIIVRDERIRWPDSFALGPDGRIWFTTAQIHLGDDPPEPYGIFRFDPKAR